jgi:hypothetical protein
MLRKLACLACLTALAACDSPKPREVPPPPAAATAPAAAAPVAKGMTEGLARLDGAPNFYLDQIGQAVDPVNKRPAVTAASQPLVIIGFAYDGGQMAPAKGVDVVIDGVARPAAYGQPRPDVASYLKAPKLTDVGYNLTLPPGAIAPGEHRLSVRVVAADGSGYAETAEVPFTIR